MGEHYARTANGQLIGPYDTVAECDAEVTAANSESGYTHCACRDCGDVSISTHIHTPELCLLCKDAGCEANNGDCQRDEIGMDAYDLIEPTMCQWFALCDHEATGTMSHPVLGEVHICDRCRAKVEAMS